MSLAFLLPTRSSSVVWRGPKKTAMVRQFLSSILWPPGTDYLLIDTPPGTSDEHISLAETLLKLTSSSASPSAASKLAGAVLVTTPQAISTSDVRKELNFCRQTAIPILGVLENMAGFVCPHCSTCTDVFSRGGGQTMASEFDVSFLGSVPLDPQFGRLVEEGRRASYPVGTEVEGRMFEGIGEGEDGPGGTEAQGRGLLVENYPSCALCPIFKRIAAELVGKIEGDGAAGEAAAADGTTTAARGGDA